MSTEYRIEIRRKSDDKLLRQCIANCMKSIMDSSYGKEMNLDDRCSARGATFDYDDIEKVEKSALDALDRYIGEYVEKKMSILLAKNVAIKHEIEDDIRYLKEDYIDEATRVVSSCGFLMGMINALVEDELVESPTEKYEDGTPELVAAYKRLASDLPTVKRKFGDREYDEKPMLFVRDVYMKVFAD